MSSTTKAKGGWMCRKNLHLWLNQTDAEKCCDGIHRRVLVFSGGENQQNCAGVMIGHQWARETEREGL